MRKRLQQVRGFTLIELLIVIAIIAILAVVVFVTLDPLTRFQDARDATRWNDIGTVLDAVKLNQVDEDGDYIASLQSVDATKYYMIGTCTTGATAACTSKAVEAACVDVTELVTEGHLPKVPEDPSSATSTMTAYYIRVNGGAVTTGACDPENTTAIELTR